MLNSEEALWKWLEGNCSEVEKSALNNYLKLFNGETIKVEATLKQ